MPIQIRRLEPADAQAVSAFMEGLAQAAPEGVRAELEVNPVNMI